MPSYFLTVRFPLRVLWLEGGEVSFDHPSGCYEKQGHVFYETDSESVAGALVDLFRRSKPLSGPGLEPLAESPPVFEVVNTADLDLTQSVLLRDDLREHLDPIEKIVSRGDWDRGDWADAGLPHDLRTFVLALYNNQARKWEPIVRAELGGDRKSEKNTGQSAITVPDPGRTDRESPGANDTLLGAQGSETNLTESATSQSLPQGDLLQKALDGLVHALEKHRLTFLYLAFPTRRNPANPGSVWETMERDELPQNRIRYDTSGKVSEDEFLFSHRYVLEQFAQSAIGQFGPGKGCKPQISAADGKWGDVEGGAYPYWSLDELDCQVMEGSSDELIKACGEVQRADTNGNYATLLPQILAVSHDNNQPRWYSAIVVRWEYLSNLDQAISAVKKARVTCNVICLDERLAGDHLRVATARGEASVGTAAAARANVKDWPWRLDCVERQLEQMPALRDLRLSCQLDFGGMPPEDGRTFPIRGERLRKSLHGRLAVRGWHTVVPRLKDARLIIGFEVCGKAYLFRDDAICPNIKDHPEHCDAETHGVCGWETWYYLDPESARGREARYWEPQELEALEHFEEAVWECVAEQAAGFGVTKSWEFLWGGSLIVLAMMKAHPLLQLRITKASDPEDPPWNFYDLVPDYVSATKYAFEAFRRMRQVKGKPQERQADVTTKPTVPGVQAQPSAEEDRSSGGAQFPAANSHSADGAPMDNERATAIRALLSPLVLIDTGLSNLYVRMRMLREENPHGVFSDTPPTKMTFAQQQEFQNRILAWTNPIQDAIEEARAKCAGIAMHVTGVIDNPAMWETDLRANLRLLGERISSFHQCGGSSTFEQEGQLIQDFGCQLYCQGTRLEDAYETVEAASSTGEGAAHEAAGVRNTATASPKAAHREAAEVSSAEAKSEPPPSRRKACEAYHAALSHNQELVSRTRKAVFLWLRDGGLEELKTAALIPREYTLPAKAATFDRYVREYEQYLKTTTSGQSAPYGSVPRADQIEPDWLTRHDD